MPELRKFDHRVWAFIIVLSTCPRVEAVEVGSCRERPGLSDPLERNEGLPLGFIYFTIHICYDRIVNLAEPDVATVASRGDEVCRVSNQLSAPLVDQKQSVSAIKKFYRLARRCRDLGGAPLHPVVVIQFFRRQ